MRLGAAVLLSSRSASNTTTIVIIKYGYEERPHRPHRLPTTTTTWTTTRSTMICFWRRPPYPQSFVAFRTLGTNDIRPRRIELYVDGWRKATHKRREECSLVEPVWFWSGLCAMRHYRARAPLSKFGGVPGSVGWMDQGTDGTTGQGGSVGFTNEWKG